MRKIDLNPTIYAFGFAVPSFIRWPLMVLTILALGITLVIPAVIVIPPISVLAAAIIGIALLALKYYFKMAPTRHWEQPRA